MSNFQWGKYFGGGLAPALVFFPQVNWRTASVVMMMLKRHVFLCKILQKPIESLRSRDVTRRCVACGAPATLTYALTPALAASCQLFDEMGTNVTA